MRKNEINGGSGLLFVMFVLFLVLKLAGVITWSWWLVTAPLWLVPALFFVIIVIALCLGIVGLFLYGLYELITLIFNKH